MALLPKMNKINKQSINGMGRQVVVYFYFIFHFLIEETYRKSWGVSWKRKTEISKIQFYKRRSAPCWPIWWMPLPWSTFIHNTPSSEFCVFDLEISTFHWIILTSWSQNFDLRSQNFEVFFFFMILISLS